MKIGAVIIADRRTEQGIFCPMMKLSGGSMIQKQVDTLRKAGAAPILVITGEESEILERHLAHRSLIFLPHDVDGVKVNAGDLETALHRLPDFCDGVLVIPSEAPLFSPASVEALSSSGRDAAVPVYREERGHIHYLSRRGVSLLDKVPDDAPWPEVLDSEPFALEEIPVEDPGVLLSADTEEQRKHLEECERTILFNSPLQLRLKASISREEQFFGPGVVTFLRKIEKTGSMLAACQEMEMAYSKGWTMIKRAETQLGFTLLDKQAGGSRGGNSFLTPKGREFLEKYEQFVSELEEEGGKIFQRYFEGM